MLIGRERGKHGKRERERDGGEREMGEREIKGDSEWDAGGTEGQERERERAELL